MANPLTLTFKKIGDVSIDLDIWFPTQVPTSQTKVPAMVWFHGGGGFCGDKNPNVSQWFPTWVKDMITKDHQWIIICPNYRLLVPTTAHEMVEDIKDAFKFIADTMVSKPIGSTLFTVDPEKLFTGGESFGGYCARLAGLYAMPKPIAILSQFGMGGDYLSPFYLAGRSSSTPLPMPFGSPFFPLPNPAVDSLFLSTSMITGTRAGDDEMGIPLSPRQDMFSYTLQLGTYLDILTGTKGLSNTLSNADNVESLVPPDDRRLIPQLLLDSSFPPTFLIHGTGDTAVSVEESRRTAAQLKELGVEYELLEVSGGEHGFDTGTKAEDGDERYEILKRSGEWLKERL